MYGAKITKYTPGVQGRINLHIFRHRQKRVYKGGYYRVSIKPTGGKQKYYLIHELVGELFLEKPLDKEGRVKDDLVVHHKNFKHGINDNVSGANLS